MRTTTNTTTTATTTTATTRCVSGSVGRSQLSQPLSAAVLQVFWCAWCTLQGVCVWLFPIILIFTAGVVEVMSLAERKCFQRTFSISVFGSISEPPKKNSHRTEAAAYLEYSTQITQHNSTCRVGSSKLPETKISPANSDSRAMRTICGFATEPRPPCPAARYGIGERSGDESGRG